MRLISVYSFKNGRPTMTMSMFEAILEAIRCYWHQPKPSITTTTVPPTPTLNLHSSLDPGLLHQVSSQFDPIIFISLFATGCAIILTTTYFVLARCRRLSRADFWAVVWFINGTWQLFSIASPSVNLLACIQEGPSTSSSLDTTPSSPSPS